MASVEAPAGPGRLSDISKVAEFLDTSRESVSRLLRERRLDGALLAGLRLRGVSATPTVKNSVQAVVRSMEARLTPPALRPGESETAAQGTATIMFTDLVDSSGMMHRLGDRDGRRVLSGCERIIRGQTAAHDGSVVKTMGDGLMVTFRSAHRAVASAVAIQRELGQSTPQHTGAPLVLRIGLTVGEPVQDGEDMYGMSVIIAARIAAMATGGQVLVSQIAHDLIASSGDFAFRPVGATELKGVPGKHLLFEVLWAEG